MTKTEFMTGSVAERLRTCYGAGLRTVDAEAVRTYAREWAELAGEAWRLAEAAVAEVEAAGDAAELAVAAEGVDAPVPRKRKK